MKAIKTTAPLAALCFALLPAVANAGPTSPSLNAPLVPAAQATPAPVAPAPAVQRAPSVTATPGLPGASAQPAPPPAPAPVQQPTASLAPAAPAGAAQSTAQAKANGGIPGVDRTPTLGDWEDLGQRRAYKAQLDKLKAAEAPATPQLGQMPAMPQLPAPTAALPPAEKPPRPRFSEACPEDVNKPCFFSVYGLSTEDGTNNYHGQLAINGRLVPGGVYKGKKFDGYTVTAISDSALTVVDKRGKPHVWPLYATTGYQADPDQLSSAKPAAQPMNPGLFPGMPSQPAYR